ncbi:MAG: DUF547 domain-containing protein [Candidatus Methylomirabilales bacterium]
MDSVGKWGIVLAGLAWLSWAAAPVQAFDDTAYARLLRAHVRPGSISGIRLNVVDYRGIKTDPNYATSLQDFATAQPQTFQTEAERFAFWVNAYNLLAIKAVIDQYPTHSIRDGGSLFRSIWKKKIGVVAGREYALDDIEHGILRKAFHEPRVHFAIVCASLSCPDLRTELYRGDRLDVQLDDAARTFLRNPAKGLRPGRDGEPTRVSRLFKWFRKDFAPAGGVAAFIRANIDTPLAARIAGPAEGELAYLGYDWSLNDAARAR